MTAVVGVVVGDHDQVGDAAADLVVAAGAAVGLVAGDSADIRPADQRPLGGGEAAMDGLGRAGAFAGGAVLARH
ncbi:MAG: hypothetical protein ACJ77A_16680 [Actinomycetota bacterium]